MCICYALFINQLCKLNKYLHFDSIWSLLPSQNNNHPSTIPPNRTQPPFCSQCCLDLLFIPITVTWILNGSLMTNKPWHRYINHSPYTMDHTCCWCWSRNGLYWQSKSNIWSLDKWVCVSYTVEVIWNGKVLDYRA